MTLGILYPIELIHFTDHSFLSAVLEKPIFKTVNTSSTICLPGFHKTKLVYLGFKDNIYVRITPLYY